MERLAQFVEQVTHPPFEHDACCDILWLTRGAFGPQRRGRDPARETWHEETDTPRNSSTRGIDAVLEPFGVGR
jgi:hypothetical protein